MVFLTTDDSIDILNLSARSAHALKGASILTIGDLLRYPVNKLWDMRNIGAKSVAEITDIIETLKQGTNNDYSLTAHHSNSNNSDLVPTARDNQTAEELQKAFGMNAAYWMFEILHAKQEHDSDDDHVYLFWIYKSPVIRKALKDTISKLIDSLSECHYSDIESVIPEHLKETTIAKEIITEMETENLISISGDIISKAFPSLIKYVGSITKERTKDVFMARLNGLTLDEIGQRYNLTRQRVQQMIDKELKKRPRLVEDKYIYLFENYAFSSEDFCLSFGEQITVFNYLESVASVSRSSRKPIIDILTDVNVPVSLRKQAEKAIYKDFVTINGVRVRKQRQELVEFVIRTQCRKLTKFADFVKLYYFQLQSIGLNEDPSFNIDEGTYTNKLAEADYVLWNQGHSFRYYYIPERDYETLLNTIDLEQYQDTELSSLKLFRDYPELMTEYDIHDEYELHNLLKKIYPKENGVVFKKMPTIAVGTPDRDSQVLDLLLEHAPISLDDFASEYEKAYGAKAATVKSNYLKNFTDYLFEGVYSITADNLPYDQFKRMKEVLTKEFYRIPQIVELYKREYPEANESLINPYTIKTLGFKINTGYAFSAKYASATEYFEKLLTASDEFSLDDLPAGVTLLPTFTQVLYEFKADRKIIECAPHQYISLSKLADYGITMEKIEEYCDAVRLFARGKKFFTVASLRDDGFNHAIGTEDFDDWFYTSLLIEKRDSFSYMRIGHTKILTNGVADLSFADMLVWIIEQRQRMTYAALNKHLEKSYGIFLPKYKLLGIIHESSLYFDPIVEEIYINYDAYKA